MMSPRKKLLREAEGRYAWFLGGLLFRMYKLEKKGVRQAILWTIRRLEGGDTYSQTLRRIFRAYHRIEVGMYSTSGCFIPENFRPGTKIGRYCVINPSARASGFYPINARSMHSALHGAMMRDEVNPPALVIGNDVLVGHNAIILPIVREIGDGAIIGAGAVVVRDVPPFAVVVGNPARIIRYRFPEEKIKELLQSKWWEKPLDELLPDIEQFQVPLDGSELVT